MHRLTTLSIGFFMTKMDISELLKRPIWQMSGEEFAILHAYAHTLYENDGGRKEKNIVVGNQALADYVACSVSTIYKLRREGVLDAAIVSHIGKRIVYNADKALELAQAHLNNTNANDNEK